MSGGGTHRPERRCRDYSPEITPLIAPRPIVDRHDRIPYQGRRLINGTLGHLGQHLPQPGKLRWPIDEGSAQQSLLQPRQIRIDRDRRQLRLGLPSRPGLSSQENFRFVIVLPNEVAEVQLLAAFATEGLQLIGHLHGQATEVLADILQHILPGEAVELNRAAGREVGGNLALLPCRC